MKNFLQTIFKTSEERVKNPFVGAFLTAWIIINWKPILLLIFSTRSIEHKISYIHLNFSKISFILIYPLVSAIFYILILPYLNLLFDELLRYAQIRKNNQLLIKEKQRIENDRELAIEEIKLEEAKINFRERNSHNKLIEDLQNKIKLLEEHSQEERKRSNTIIKELNDNLKKRSENLNTQISNLENELSFNQEEIIKLQKELFEKDRKIQEFQSTLNTKKLNVEQNAEGVIHLSNGTRLSVIKNGNQKYYYDNDKGTIYSEVEFKKLLNNNKD